MRTWKMVVTALVVATGLAAPAGAHPGVKVKVIASGLDAPRHLAFGSHGDLYVAEAGRGAGVALPADSPQCFVAGEGPACMGATGAITKIDRRGHQRRILSGLASFANSPSVTNPIGPHGITVVGHHVVFTNGGPTEPKDAAGATILRDELATINPVADLFGRLLVVGHHGRVHRIADIWGFERAVNPDA